MGCTFSSLGECFGNAAYSSERFSALAATCVVCSCLAVTLLVLVSVCVGAGYHYSYVSFRSGPIDYRKVINRSMDKLSWHLGHHMYWYFLPNWMVDPHLRWGYHPSNRRRVLDLFGPTANYEYAIKLAQDLMSSRDATASAALTASTEHPQVKRLGRKNKNNVQ